MARYVIDGADHFIPIISEICWNCLHFDEENFFNRRCKAFPDGIPLEIWLGKNDHTEPFPNDNGFRYEQIETNEL